MTSNDRTHPRVDQISILGMLELTAGCALVVGAAASRSLLVLTLVFAVLTIWSTRVPAWPARWSIMAALGGCCLLSLGLLCLEHAFAVASPDARMVSFRILAFFGPVLSILGTLFGVTGACLFVGIVWRSRLK